MQSGQVQRSLAALGMTHRKPLATTRGIYRGTVKRLSIEGQPNHTMPTIEQHFERTDPTVRVVYDTILETARRFGPVVEDPKKTSIHLNRRTAFAGIATRKTAIIMTLKSSSDIEDPRVVKRQKVSTNRWYIDVRLETPRDLNAKVTTWLERSYALAE